MTKLQGKYNSVHCIWFRLDLTDFHIHLVLCFLNAEDKEDFCAYREVDYIKSSYNY